MSISMDPELGDEVRSAAQRTGKNLSSWMADAAKAKLRSEALANFLSGWEAQHGSFTSEELARAETELGLGNRENP